MKIVHLCFVEPYLDNWSYQANLLPEYQAKAGHDVVVIAGLDYCPAEYKDYNDAGTKARTYTISRVKIIRLPLRINLLNRLVLPKGLYAVLDREKPDLIFMHSLNNLSVATAVHYKRVSGCKLYADIHSDWYNSGKNLVSRYLLHGFFWRLMYMVYQRHLDRIFAITEDCADFAHYCNGIDRSKIEILNLGADTDSIHWDQRQQIRQEIREQHNIDDNDFVVVTAGKLNANKKVDLLIKAVKAINDKRLKLLIIGSMEPGYRETLLTLADGDNKIQFAGWQDSARIIDYYLAADIAAFPGTQSVLWQSAICCGLPTILRWWGETVSYLNIGNAFFLRSDDETELAGCIKRLMEDRLLYKEMAEKAQHLCNTVLSYDVVAGKSLPDMGTGR